MDVAIHSFDPSDRNEVVLPVRTVFHRQFDRAASDVIDILGKKATGASVNGADQLVIVNGTKAVATLQLAGSYSGATFSVGSM